MTEYHVARLVYSCLEIFAFSAMAVEQLTFGHRSRTIQCLKSLLSAFCDYLCHSSLSLRCYVHERLMHMTQNWKVSKWSSNWLNSTRFPGDVCVALFNVPPGNKDAVSPNPLMERESCRVCNCENEHLSGSTKRWIFKSM